MKVITGKWTERELDDVIREASEISDAGRRIDILSKGFLGTDYRESTLIGSMSSPEVFVVNLAGVDCSTFIDYIEAMRISASFSDFIGNLQKIRYRDGNISFESRNHFFTDWREFNADLTEDVTEEVGKETAVRLRKILNKKEYGTCWVPGLPQVEREIRYIPSGAVSDKVADRLRTGDYAGVYTDAPGLDVSHVGIIIRDGDLVYLRHASSRRKKVVDEDLRNYLSDKPGLLVFRPKE